MRIRGILVLVTGLFLVSLPSSASWSRSYEGVRYINAVADSPDGSTLALFVMEKFPGPVAVVRLSSSDGSVMAARQLPEWKSAQRLVPLTSGGALIMMGEGGVQPKTRAVILDRDLNPVAQTVFPTGEHEAILGGIATPDGGALLVMKADGASAAMKLSPKGAIEWHRRYDASGEDFMLDIRPARDGYVAWGKTINGTCPYLMKLGRDGQVIWARSFRSGGGFDELMELGNGDIVTFGATYVQDKLRLWLQKLDDHAAPILELASPDWLPTGSAAAMRNGRFLVLTAMEGDLLVASISADGAVLEQAAMNGASKSRLFAGQRWVYEVGSQVITAFDSASIPAGIPPSTTRIRLTPAEVAGMPQPFEFANDPRASSPEGQLVSLKAIQIPSSASTTATRPVREKPVRDQNADKAKYDPEAFRTRIREELLRKNFDDLDSTASGLRQWTVNPFPTLSEFYDAVADPGLRGTLPIEDHLTLLQEWVKTRPKSITALVAIAEFHLDRASQLRSGDFSDKVTRTGAEGYEKELTESAEALKNAEAAASTDFYYYVIAVSLAGQSGGDVREIAMKSLKSGVHAEPFMVAANFLLPQWGGTPEEYAEWAARTADLTREHYGDGIYADLAFSAVENAQMLTGMEQFAFRIPVGKTIFDELHLSWPRTKQGFLDNIPKCPSKEACYHRMARMAALAGDRATAKELFARPELAWSAGANSVWYKKDFDTTKAWVEKKTFEESVTALNPARITLRSSITTGTSEFRYVNSFLIETPKGIAVISAVLGDPMPAVFNLNPQSSGPQPGAISQWLLSPNGGHTPITLARRGPAGYSVKRLRSHGVIALLDGTPEAVGGTAFKVARVDRSKDAVVVGCAAGASACTPKVLVGTLNVPETPPVIPGENPSESAGRFYFVPANDSIDLASLVGSPIIQDDAVGVVIAADEKGAVCQPLIDGGIPSVEQIN